MSSSPPMCGSVAETAMGHVRLKVADGSGSDRSRRLGPALGRRLPHVRMGRSHAQRYVSLHHPFSAPREEQVALLESDPANCISACYDLVINGSEVGGGSIRIHDPAVQAKVFELIGLSDEEAVEKFGFLLEALKYRSTAPRRASPSDSTGWSCCSSAPTTFVM